MNGNDIQTENAVSSCSTAVIYFLYKALLVGRKQYCEVSVIVPNVQAVLISQPSSFSSMMFSKLSTAILPLFIPLSYCEALNTVSFSDAGVGLEISLAIPDAKSAPFPMYMTMTAPTSVGWGGFATGGCMLRSPLILAWPNGDNVMVTTRWAAYVSLSRFLELKAN